MSVCHIFVTVFILVHVFCILVYGVELMQNVNHVYSRVFYTAHLRNYFILPKAI